MFEFLTADENMPFTVSLTVMFGMAILEGVTALFGAALSSLLDSLLPSLDLDVDADIDLDGPEVQTPNALSRLLGWLRVGQVPLLMLLVIFLTGFGLIGLGLQSVWHNATGTLLPGAMASAPALLLALPVVRMLGGALGRIMPKDETDAVSEESLLGRIATITLGTARQGTAAEAKVRDVHGRTHYVMVEPDAGESPLPAGTEVLLVQRRGAVFVAIRNPNPALSGD